MAYQYREPYAINLTATDPVTRKAVWERFERDHPLPGPALEDWVAALAAESGIPERVIRRVITEGSAQMLQTINAKALTFAQEIAERMGANLTSAFAVLREAYDATRKKVLLDKAGRPKLQDPRPDGPGMIPSNMIYIEVPDWPARLQAVKTTIEIFGARPPQQVEIKGHMTNAVVDVSLEMSTEEILRELQRLPDEITKLQRAYGAIAEGSPLALGPGKTIEGATFH